VGRLYLLIPCDQEQNRKHHDRDASLQSGNDTQRNTDVAITIRFCLKPQQSYGTFPTKEAAEAKIAELKKAVEQNRDANFVASKQRG
jgi:hypothetical protein